MGIMADPGPQNSDERPRYLGGDLPHLVPQGRLLQFDFCAASLQVRGSYGRGLEMMALELLRQLGKARSSVVGSITRPRIVEPQQSNNTDWYCRSDR